MALTGQVPPPPPLPARLCSSLPLSPSALLPLLHASCSSRIGMNGALSLSLSLSLCARAEVGGGVSAHAHAANVV
eukprot:2341137-Rhodomonas_salina.1